MLLDVLLVFFEDFYIYIHKGYWFVIFLWCFWFWYRGNISLTAGKCFHLFYFPEVCERLVLIKISQLKTFSDGPKNSTTSLIYELPHILSFSFSNYQYSTILFHHSLTQCLTLLGGEIILKQIPDISFHC